MDVGMGAGNIGVVPIPAPGCSPCWLLLGLPLLLLPLLFIPGTSTTTTTIATTPIIQPSAAGPATVLAQHPGYQPFQGRTGCRSE